MKQMADKGISPIKIQDCRARKIWENRQNQTFKGHKYPAEQSETTGSTEIESKLFSQASFSLLAQALKENWLNLRNLFQQKTIQKGSASDGSSSSSERDENQYFNQLFSPNFSIERAGDKKTFLPLSGICSWKKILCSKLEAPNLLGHK